MKKFMIRSLIAFAVGLVLIIVGTYQVANNVITKGVVQEMTTEYCKIAVVIDGKTYPVKNDVFDAMVKMELFPANPEGQKVVLVGFSKASSAYLFPENYNLFERWGLAFVYNIVVWFVILLVFMFLTYIYIYKLMK